MDPSAVIDVLRTELPAAAAEPAASADMPTVYVERDAIRDVLRLLRNHPSLQFGFFVDITAADFLPAEPRFEVVYHLAALGAAYQTVPGAPAPPARIRVKIRVSADDPRVPSAVPVFPGANWPEREIFDLFGLSFDDHPDLRRILMPDDWEGAPLRRDYPVQIRKDTQAWEPLQISPEEFAANIRAQRERAHRQADGEGR